MVYLKRGDPHEPHAWFMARAWFVLRNSGPGLVEQPRAEAMSEVWAAQQRFGCGYPSHVEREALGMAQSLSPGRLSSGTAPGGGVMR
jgi:hypothetical protein